MRNRFLLSVFLLSIFFSGNAQTDTTLSTGETVNTVNLEQLKEEQLTVTEKVPKSFLGRNPVKGFIAPVIMVGVGAALINNPLYDRKDFKVDRSLGLLPSLTSVVYPISLPNLPQLLYSES